ncbi:MAG: CDP-glycerol glycerophosphotransferase family protein [Candidatus Pacebacteria bacterium]|jgi:hypothetical protein|nr:CDP-glycerol glycerophosphotransferase family protein [Candidatus Paceibacterota bacterium]
MKKTIIITIIRGMTARNLLRNAFFEILREKFNLIILTPAANDERFVKEFGHPNVKFAYFKERGHSPADKIFVGLNKYLVYNKYIGLKLKYGIRGLSKPEDLSIFRYWLYTIIFKPLSKIRILRDFVKWLDYLFVQRKEVKEFKELIKKENPVLVISTSIMSDIETAVIKAAKKMKVKVIGMPKSWDNPSRAGFRAKADILVVWSDFMAEQSERFQNYKRKDIKVIGIPQFDYYTDKSRIWSKEKFCNEFGLDVNKKIILFTSEGKVIPEDKEIASIIYDFIKNNELVNDCQLLIRPHFAYKDEEKKFTHLLGKSNVSIDLSNNPSSCFRDHADYSWNHMERFLNSLYHADVVVNVASTIALDGISIDRPIIHFAYDVYENMAKTHSLKLCYASDYNLEIVKTGATKLAKSREEFRNLINRYLEHPEFESKQRQELRDKFCYKIDGNSGKRFADIVIEETNE